MLASLRGEVSCCWPGSAASPSADASAPLLALRPLQLILAFLMPFPTGSIQTLFSLVCFSCFVGYLWFGKLFSSFAVLFLSVFVMLFFLPSF